MTEPPPPRPPAAPPPGACPTCAGHEARIWELLEENDALAQMNLELLNTLTAVRGQLADAQAALVRAGKRDGRA